MCVKRTCFRHYAEPLIPKLPGLETFPGEVMHSHNYRAPESFDNKTVVCLGAASSGQDISIDLSTAAKMVGEAAKMMGEAAKMVGEAATK